MELPQAIELAGGKAIRCRPRAVKSHDDMHAKTMQLGSAVSLHRLPLSADVSPVHGTRDEHRGEEPLLSEASQLVMLRQRVQELEALAYLDSLTEIANRRLIELTLRQRLEERLRLGWTFGVLMADIDHFKSINDQYGHAVGDEVLRMVSQTLAHNCRIFDIIGRWGGEEFVGVFPHVSPTLLQQLAERLRHLVATSFLVLPDKQTISVTISLGATIVQQHDSVNTLLHRIDQAQYQSKAQGRNCVTLDVCAGVCSEQA